MLGLVCVLGLADSGADFVHVLTSFMSKIMLCGVHHGMSSAQMISTPLHLHPPSDGIVDCWFDFRKTAVDDVGNQTSVNAR